MPRFFFHVVDGSERVLDLEGWDLPTLDAARREAVASARELVADAVRGGKSVPGRSFEIADEAGAVLALVPFPKVEAAG